MTSPAAYLRLLRTRIRERVVARAIDARLKRRGMDPTMLPPMLQRSVAAAGLPDEDLARILSGVRSFTGWSDQWREVALTALSNGDLERTWRAAFIAQRSFDERSEARESLYHTARDAYHEIHPPMHIFHLPHSDGGEVVALLDLPDRPDHRRAFDIVDASPAEPVPLLVLFPGLGVVAEELHDIAELAWQRGWATLRVDGPGWGATTIRMRPETSLFARDIVEHVLDSDLATRHSIDPSRVMTAGTCIGGVFALIAATSGRIRHVVSVSAPWTLELIVDHWPSPVRRLVESAAQLRWREAARELGRWSRAHRSLVRDLPATVEVHAAGRDRMAPRADQERLVADIASDRVTFTCHQDEVHACPGVLDEIIVAALDRELDRARAGGRLLADPGLTAVEPEPGSER